MDWSYIIKSFDRPPYILEDALQMPDVIALFYSALSMPGDQNTAAVNGLFNAEWKHQTVLLRILDVLTATSHFPISTLPALAEARMIHPEDVEGIPNASEAVANPWNCLRLFEVLGRISRGSNAEDARRANALLERAANNAAELAVTGLVQVSVSRDVNHGLR
jgi:hypothetical protein